MAAKQTRRFLSFVMIALSLMAASCATKKYGCPGHLNDSTHQFGSR